MPQPSAPRDVPPDRVPTRQAQTRRASHDAASASAGEGRVSARARRVQRNLPLAIASGVVLAASFIASVLLSAWAAIAFLAVMVVIALLELDVAFRGLDVHPATPVAIVAGLVMMFGAYAVGPSAQALGLVLLVFAAMVWLLVDAGGARARRATRGIGAALGATFLMTLWLPFLASYAGLLLSRESGTWYLLTAVALSVFNDIGAFAFGSAFGTHKLAPSVSPAKSWEGFAGGIATTLLLAWLVVARLPGFDVRSALLVGLGVAIAGTFGDLAESMVKRDLGVKDLGRIVPGHGGIMDRADALVFAIPAAHVILLALGE